MNNFGIVETVFNELILLFSQNPNIEKAALFGSRAMGKFKDGSDIDIALFGENITLNDQLDLSIKLEKLGYPYTYDFQIHKNIKDKNMLDHIERIGIVIYQKAS
jgi:predicted nucleotidyltransferase